MPFDSSSLSTTLDRADRGLDHAPPGEPDRERPPLNPAGTLRHSRELAPAGPVNAVCEVCDGRGSSALASSDSVPVCSSCGGRGVLPAPITGFPSVAERAAAQQAAADRALSYARAQASLGLELSIHYLREAAAYLLAAGERGKHELALQQLDILVAVERHLNAGGGDAGR